MGTGGIKPLQAFHRPPGRLPKAAQSKVVAPFKTPGHDHAACVAEALHNAEASCARLGLLLTPLRRHILTMIWQGHRPVRAYDILQQLGREGRRPSPPTAYRALAFLEQAGLVHRIESENAYVGCARPDNGHHAQFFICESCARIAEVNDARLNATIGENARALGFQPGRLTVEIRGMCAACATRNG
jgi:Fur family zinc uptake transcriptional regulator